VTRIVVLNAGLLRRLGGLVEPAPEVEPRLHALPAALEGTSADLVALQEVYDPAHRWHLEKALSASYPTVLDSSRRNRLRLNDGLFVLCRCVASSRFIPFDHGLIEERWLARKGILVVTANFDAPLVLLNVHTTAGGLFRHPESPQVDTVRAGQLAQLLSVAAQVEDRLVLIVGDINAGPGVSNENYEMFRERGWVDIWSALHPAEAECTWRPDNPLNMRGPHRRCPPQRIDHAFARRTDLNAGRLVVRRCEIVFRDATVRTPRGPLVPVSDHFGLLLDLDIIG
jgi:endonuclease/exonuclease/phosphatase family metal-dependent hydrolase